jgi:hypothetical protein
MMMMLKTQIVSGACLLCSVVLFPLVVIGTGLGLFVLAVGTESSHLLTGTAVKGIDHSAAHEMALRICFGYRAGAGAHGRCAR